MKKAFAFLLLTITTALFLSACSHDGAQLSADSPVTLNLWHVYGSQTESPLNSLIDGFNRSTGREKGVLVNVTSVTNSTDIDAALIASAQREPGAAALPDMFTAYPRIVEKLDSERLLNWSEYLSDEALSSYMPDFLSEGMFGERLLMLPIAKSTELCFINRTLFERFAAENDASLDDMTDFEQLFELCMRYYDWSGGQSLFQINDFYHYFITGVSSLGGDFMTKDGSGGRIDFASDAFERVWRPMARAGIHGGLCIEDGYASDRWKTAEVISNIGSTAGILYLRNYVTYADNTTHAIETAILPYPRFAGASPTVMQRGTGLFAVLSDDERKNRAAAIFAGWITSGQPNVEFVTKAGYLPVTKEGFDSLISGAYSVSNEKYRLLYDTVSGMYGSYAFCAQPRYDGAADVQAKFERSIKQVLRSAHAQYARRTDAGENAEAVMSQLESAALDELIQLMQ